MIRLVLQFFMNVVCKITCCFMYMALVGKCYIFLIFECLLHFANNIYTLTYLPIMIFDCAVNTSGLVLNIVVIVFDFKWSFPVQYVFIWPAILSAILLDPNTLLCKDGINQLFNNRISNQQRQKN